MSNEQRDLRQGTPVVVSYNGESVRGGIESPEYTIRDNQRVPTGRYVVMIPMDDRDWGWGSICVPREGITPIV